MVVSRRFQRTIGNKMKYKPLAKPMAPGPALHIVEIYSVSVGFGLGRRKKSKTFRSTA